MVAQTQPPAELNEAPQWRAINLPGRGTLQVRDSRGPAGRPVVLLLHGATVSADVNWCRSYGPVAERARVIALDHRGHGRFGLRPDGRVRLEQCADDAAAVARALEVERFVAVGYSMGGAIAQLLWRRHPHLVSGLVLCATAMRFRQTASEWVDYALVRLGEAPAVLLSRRAWPIAERVAAARAPAGAGTGSTPFDEWARSEIRAGSLRSVLQASAACHEFDSSPWVDQVDVPTAVVVCAQDLVVPTARQRQLANVIRDATVLEIPADHLACVTRPTMFLPALDQALTAAISD